MEQQELSSRKYSMAEAAKLLGVSRMTVVREIARRKLGCFRVGGRVLISTRHITDYLRRVESVPRKASHGRGG